MSRRAEVLAEVAARIGRLGPGSPRLVAVDGVDGAGKTVVADELAVAVRSLERPVIRASIDGFHRSREVRHARGRSSPEGFFHDSYDYPRFVADVVAPVRPRGSRAMRTAAFDHVRADFATTFARMADRDGCPLDPEHPANRRYLQGQRIYLVTCEPELRADIVVDNRDPAAPWIVRAGREAQPRAMSATTATVNAMRSAGASETSNPRRPPET